MRLSELLRERKEAILREFEDFARTHSSAGSSMKVEALRDHAARMLDAIALDLEEPQTETEQERKGKGDAPQVKGAPQTAAEEHGVARAESGFSLEETFAEYRALRASVMRYYVAERSQPDIADVQDVIRFNEGLDQALAEAISEYGRAVTRYREMFLAVLGHDLRSPLAAILGASGFLAASPELSGPSRRLAATIGHGAQHMNEMIQDLLDYASSQLGQHLALRRSRADLGEIAADVVHEVETGHSDREVRLHTQGDLVGEWDVARVQEILSNLVTNAVKHATEGSPVTVSVSTDGADGVVAAVHNLGAPIPEQERELIFEPFRRASSSRREERNGLRPRGVGLGLYIARRMAEAHGGTVRLESSTEAGTTFALRLPRRPPEPSDPSDEASTAS